MKYAMTNYRRILLSGFALIIGTQGLLPLEPVSETNLFGTGFSGYGLAHAQTTRGVLDRDECDVRINYQDTDIKAVIKEIAINTGRAITIDRSVNGQVSLQTPEDFTVCPDEAWSLFQDLLRQNGYVATPQDDGRYAVVPINQAQRSPGPVGDTKDRGGLISRIFQLEHIDAQEAARNIAQINSEGAVASAIRSNNSLLVVDTTGNMDRIAKIIKSLDRDNRVFQTIQLVHASARDVAGVLINVAQDLAQENNNTTSRVSITPVDVSNSLLIRAEPNTMEQLTRVVSELDRQGENANDISVIGLKHADAEEMLPLLRELVDVNAGAAPTPAAGGANGQQSSVISAYAPTNSIIVNGNTVLRREVETIISQLDIRRAQVLVEAIIVDISDSAAREVGVQYFLAGNGGNNIPFSTNVAGQSPNILSAAGGAFTSGFFDGAVTTTGADGDVIATDDGDDFTSALQTAAVGSLLGISGFGLGGAGTFGDGNVFGALLTALKTDISSRVLSTPSVVTLDNQTASLSDGQEIPITTGEQIGDDFSNAFRTVSREQVGVILEVTPQITDGDIVSLEIRQEISSVDGPIIATSTDLITNNSELNTTALVDSGDILVVGGLISDSQAVQEDKVPFLGDIPGIGNLFKTTAKSKVKNNLMIFIRPTILRDRSSARAATRRKFDFIRAQEVLNDARAQEDFNRLLNDITGVPTSVPASGPREN